VSPAATRNDAREDLSPATSGARVRQRRGTNHVQTQPHCKGLAPVAPVVANQCGGTEPEPLRYLEGASSRSMRCSGSMSTRVVQITPDGN